MTYFQLLGPFLLIVFAISFLLIRRRFPELRSAGHFAASYVCLAAALVVEWLRGGIDPVTATYLTNIPYLGTIVFFASGLFSFGNRAVPWRGLFGMATAVMALLIWFRHVDPSLIWRTITMNVGVAGMMLFAVARCLPQADTILKKAILWSLATSAVATVIRMIPAILFQEGALTQETYTGSILYWTLQLVISLTALTVAVLLFAHYGLTVMRMLTEEGIRKRQQVQAQFARFLSPAVVDRLVTEDAIDLSPETREITALLVDLRGFTAFSERHGPDAASARATTFFEVATGEILARDGTIDKYLGDAVLAFWNAPLAQPDHADRALAAAQAIQAQLAERRDDMQAVTTLESGLCRVGNVGTAERLNYTAIGDAMNLVSRLEAEAKARGLPLLAGPGLARRSTAPLPEIGRATLRGLAAETTLHAPISALVSD